MVKGKILDALCLVTGALCLILAGFDFYRDDYLLTGIMTIAGLLNIWMVINYPEE